MPSILLVSLNPNDVTKMYEVIEGRVISDWKKFISSGENKQSLIRFLGDYIVKHINQNSSLQEG
jgi:hypothetical protein